MWTVAGTLQQLNGCRSSVMLSLDSHPSVEIKYLERESAKWAIQIDWCFFQQSNARGLLLMPFWMPLMVAFHTSWSNVSILNSVVLCYAPSQGNSATMSSGKTRWNNFFFSSREKWITDKIRIHMLSLKILSSGKVRICLLVRKNTGVLPVTLAWRI